MPQRPTLTCKRCREKRIKCDKEAPCSSCIKSNNSNSCVYDENADIITYKGGTHLHVFRVSKANPRPSRARTTQLASEVPQYYTATEDIINFHESDFPCFGSPLEWSFVEQKDPALQFLQTWRSLDTGGQSSDQTMDKQQLRQQIKLHLPPKAEIQEAINYFFDRIYFYVPLVDYAMTYEDLESIVEVGGGGQYLSITVHQFVTVGLLLAILGFVAALKERIGITADTKHISLARQCFFSELSLNFRKFQLGMIILLYDRVVPDPAGIHGIPPLLTRTLVDMAHQLRLDVRQEITDLRKHNLYGKAWHLLKVFDTMDATRGLPLLVRRSSEKYFLPVAEITSNSSNTPNLDLEMSIILFFGTVEPLLATLRDLVEMAANKKGTKAAKAGELIQVMEILIESVLGTFKGKLTPMPEEASAIQVHHKSLAFKSLLNNLTFLLTLYTHLRIHFERKMDSDMAFYYQKKIVQLTIVELLPIVSPLVDNHSYYYGHMGALITTKYFIACLQRASHMALATLTHLKYHLYHLSEEYGTDAFFLVKVSSMAETCLGVYWSCLRRLLVQNRMDLSSADVIKQCLDFIDTKENLPYELFGGQWRIRYSSAQLFELMELFESGMKDIPFADSATSSSVDVSPSLFHVDFEADCLLWL